MMAKKPVEVYGFKETEALLVKFPNQVQAAAYKTGYKKAANRFRTLIRRDTPISLAGARKGLLRKSIQVKQGKRGAWYIGLKKVKNRIAFYYKTLEFDSARGPAMHVFFMDSVRKNQDAMLNLMLSEVTKALYREAGKAYSKQKSSLKK